MKIIGIIGEKIGMTQIVGETGGKKGILIPVTLIKTDKNIISQIKTLDKEGYNSCQLSFKECNEKNINKPSLGHLKKNNISARKHLFEIRDMDGEIGSEILLTDFVVGNKVKIKGITKGKGFSGVIKRHGFKIGAMSHGSGGHRQIGSMSAGHGSNQKVSKGKKMPGQMGNKQVTKITIIEKIDASKNLIFMRGAVPGPNKGIVVIRQVSK